MRKVRKKISYRGQKIYVGIDVHKKTWSVAVCTAHTNFRPFSQESDPSLLVNYLHQNYPEGDYHCAYEAGFSGYWLQEYLTAKSINCLVIHSADIPTTDRESEFKTDVRDAKKIAESLRAGQLHGIHLPSKLRQQERSLIRVRRHFRIDLARQKCRIKSLLMFYGIDIPDGQDKSRWSLDFRNWLWNLELPNETGTIALRQMMGMFCYVRGMRNHMDILIGQLGNEAHYVAPVKLLETVPGISKKRAVKILVELGDISRFSSLNKLCNYIGLVPATHNSGERKREGRLTHRGHKELRMMLVEAAWVAIGIDPALEQSYQNFKKRMIAQRAIIKIARKLLNRIRHVLLHQVPYEKGIVQ